MATTLAILAVLALALSSPRELFAAKGGTYLEFQSSDLGALKWFLVVALAAIALIVLFSALRNRIAASRARSPRVRKEQEREQHFRTRARALGFKLSETRTLGKITARLSSKKPESLLTSTSGRKYLVSNLQKRLRRRKREIQEIHRILDKLDKMQKQDLHEREFERVEANLPIWVAMKVQHPTPDHEEEEAGDVYMDAQSVAGRMLDISEGGAAISVDIDIEQGDLIEFWSGDIAVAISPLVAGVVQLEQDAGDQPPIFHLHFLDPNLAELRAAILVLKARSEPTISG